MKTISDVQLLSASVFLIFLTIHLTNTMAAALGLESYNTFQTLAQKFYQVPLVEITMVFLPLIVHATCGVVLLLRKRKQKQKQKRSLSLKQKCHSFAGMFLLLVVLGHAAATRGITLYSSATVGFEGVSFSIWWMPEVFYPYYFLLFMAGCYHAIFGSALVVKKFAWKKGLVVAKQAQNPYLFLTLSIIAITALLSFGGQLYDIPNPADNDYARAYSRLLGIEL